MYIINEYAACVFLAFAGAILLFTAGILFAALKEGYRLLAQMSRERARKAAELKASWLAAESRVS